jgi:hypothetical protein
MARTFADPFLARHRQAAPASPASAPFCGHVPLTVNTRHVYMIVKAPAPRGVFIRVTRASVGVGWPVREASICRMVASDCSVGRAGRETARCAEPGRRQLRLRWAVPLRCCNDSCIADLLAQPRKRAASRSFCTRTRWPMTLSRTVYTIILFIYTGFRGFVGRLRRWRVASSACLVSARPIAARTPSAPSW